MESLKQEHVRSMIGNFFMENWTKGKVHKVKQFKAMGIYAQNTICKVLKGLRNELELKESLDLKDQLLNCLLNKPIKR